MSDIKTLKMILREKDVPFFSDEELQFYLDRADGNLDRAAYQCFLIKAEMCRLTLSGLTIADTSAYWLRLAALYRPNGSTVMAGG